MNLNFDGKKISFGNFLPVNQGKNNEDLFDIQNNQVRYYHGNSGTIKNLPLKNKYNWFTIVSLWPDQHCGTLFVISVDGQICTNHFVNGEWSKWQEIKASALEIGGALSSALTHIWQGFTTRKVVAC